MKPKKVSKRKAQPGKYAGRSLHVTAPATAVNPRNIADVLAGMEQLAKGGRIGDPVKVLFIVGECRRALATGNAEGAAWAAWTLAERNARNKLDGFAEPILRDHARQGGTGKGGRTKRSSAVAVWKDATAQAVQARGRECSADEAWGWLKAQRIPVPGGAVMIEDNKLVFDGDDSIESVRLTYDAWRRYLTKAKAKTDLRSK